MRIKHNGEFRTVLEGDVCKTLDNAEIQKVADAYRKIERVINFTRHDNRDTQRLEKVAEELDFIIEDNLFLYLP